MISATILDELRQIAGVDYVRTDAGTIQENSTDATKRFHPADVIVFVENAAQVSAIVRLSNREGIPVVSRGGGVGYAGGAIPVLGGIVISMKRMNRILEINPVDLLVVLEPGVITGDLHDAVEAKGLFYPPDPASLKQSSIGGNVAHNAGGPRAFKYGVTRQYLLGLDVVLPTGELVHTGGRVVKNAVAYDLTDLMCGSEGTLGIITRLTMRLLPKPEAAFTVMALFDSVRSAAEAANRMIVEGIIPSKLELVDRQSLQAIRAYIQDEKIETQVKLPSGANALLLVEVDGDRVAALALLERIRLSLRSSALDVQEAGDGSGLWAIRRYLSPAVGRIRPQKINEDIVVPRSRVPDYLEAMESLQVEYDLPIVCFGHVGDGNMHVNIMIDASNPSERERGEHAKRRVFELAVAMGGTISGEHGIGIMKSEFLPLALQADAIAAMKRIKTALDPNNIMNPGEDFSVHLILDPGVLEAMVQYALSKLPQESCGLVSGSETTASQFIPIANRLESATEFDMEPAELIAAMRSIRENHRHLLAIYHSHPRGPAMPSPRDVERAHYPEAAHIIVSLATAGTPVVRGFRIVGAEVMEIELRAIV